MGEVMCVRGLNGPTQAANAFGAASEVKSDTDNLQERLKERGFVLK